MLSDVECTVVFHIDNFEILTVSKCVFTYFLERAGKRDFFDSTTPETLSSDALHAVRNYNTSELLTVIKCPFFESLQRRWKFDALYRTLIENTSFPVILVNDFFFSELL